MKRTVIVISLIIVCVAGVALAFMYYEKTSSRSTLQSEAVSRGTVEETITAIGKTKSADVVDLAFNTQGRVSRVLTSVGSSVTIGSVLATLDTEEIDASFKQAQAAVATASAQYAQSQALLSAQEIKLQDIKMGTRSEEISITQTRIDAAQSAINDAENSLHAVTTKTDTDLSNAYTTIPQTLQDAYLKADDAIHKQTDDLLNDDDSANPKLSFVTTDSQAENDVLFLRLRITSDMASWKDELFNLAPVNINNDNELLKTKGHLTLVQQYLTRLMDATNSASGIAPSTISSYKANINTSRTNINTALTSLTTAQQTIAAVKAMNATLLSSAKSSYDAAQHTLAEAQSQLTLQESGATANQIKTQESIVAQARADVLGAQARVQQQQAATQVIQSQRDKSILRAPMNGVVKEKQIVAGQIVSPNIPAFTLMSQGIFQIELFVPESDIAKLTIGNPARVSLDAYGPSVIFSAHIVALDPAEHNKNGISTYKVTLQFDSQDDRIKSGMTSNITIPIASHQNVLRIPATSIIHRDADSFALIPSANNTSSERLVHIGLTGSDGMIEIVSGLTDSDRIIIFGK